MNDMNQRFVFGADVILQRFNQEALLVDLDSESIFQINQTGARIAELISEEQSIQEILTVLDQEYEKDSSDIERDLLAFLEELLAHELIAGSKLETKADGRG